MPLRTGALIVMLALATGTHLARAALDLAVGDEVELKASSAQGVPLHERSESSMQGRLPDGTKATVLELGPKNWIRIRAANGQTGWIVRRYIEGDRGGPGNPAEPRPTPRSEDRPPPRTPPPPWTGTSTKTAYAGLPKGAPPGCSSVLELRNIGFTIGYCEELRVPVWVVYSAGPPVFPERDRPQRFETDSRTRARVAHDNYKGSGYDRGHMAPNFAISTRYGQEAQLQSFLMSNIVPQRPNLNQKVWRDLEHRIAEEWAVEFDEVWVSVGPVFGQDVERLPSGVAIPESCYMLVVDEQKGRPRVLAYLVPQDVRGDEKPEQFLTSVDAVERRTGLDFFWKLEDGLEASLEKATATKSWDEH